MLITFSGVDCAGKTTQISLLENALARRGERTSVFWLRPGYSPELNALKSLARRVVPRALPTSSDPAARAKTFERAGVSAAWIRVAAMDMAFQYGVKLRAMSASGRVVIADRYLDDSLLDLELRFPGRKVDRWPALRVAKALSPRPAHAFLLMLPHAEMLRRMEIKNEPFPDPPDIRDRRYEAYERMAATGRYQVIDAGRSVEEVHADVLQRVLRG
jgi:thymidylate kinase